MKLRRTALTAAAALATLAGGLSPVAAQSIPQHGFSYTGKVTVLNSSFSHTDRVTVIDAPASVENGQQEHDTHIQVFQERLAMTVTNNVAVDFTTRGTYNSFASLPTTRPSVRAGDVVNSYLVHVDRTLDTTQAPTNPYEGALTFEDEIIGVMVRGVTLVEGHEVFGHPLTRYPDTGNHGVLELGGGDSVVFTEPNTLHIKLTNWNVTDQIRVITKVSRP